MALILIDATRQIYIERRWQRWKRLGEFVVYITTPEDWEIIHKGEASYGLPTLH